MDAPKRVLTDIYYLAFPHDNRYNKILVYAIFLVETVQTVLITHDSFHSFAIGYGNINVLNSAQLEWIAIPIMSGAGTSTLNSINWILIYSFIKVSMVVQMYYGYRLTILSGSRTLGILISVVRRFNSRMSFTAFLQTNGACNRLLLHKVLPLSRKASKRSKLVILKTWRQRPSLAVQ